MIYKSRDIIYFFDLDGTIFGFGCDYLKSPLWFIKNGPIFNPNKWDIRWNILCGRPRRDAFFIRLSCAIFGLRPINIITYKNRFKREVNSRLLLDYKIDYMKLVIEGNQKKFSDVAKVFYIDSNLDSVCYVNTRRQKYPLMAITVKDFVEENFNVFL